MHAQTSPQHQHHQSHNEGCRYDGPGNWLVGAEEGNHGLCIFVPNLATMNTQEVITPVAKFIEWTFETVLVPMSSPFNIGVVVLGFAGLFFWLRLQKKYTAKAEEEGGIV